jgi:hypothetical protein
MSSVSAIIAKLEKQLKALKVSTKKNEKKPEKKNKGKISDVSKKTDLKKFTVVELKEFIKKNKIATKKTDKLHKDDWINLIWNNIKSDSSDESEESEESDESSNNSDTSVSEFEELD